MPLFTRSRTAGVSARSAPFIASRVSTKSVMPRWTATKCSHACSSSVESKSRRMMRGLSSSRAAAAFWVWPTRPYSKAWSSVPSMMASVRPLSSPRLSPTPSTRPSSAWTGLNISATRSSRFCSTYQSSRRSRSFETCWVVPPANGPASMVTLSSVAWFSANPDLKPMNSGESSSTGFPSGMPSTSWLSAGSPVPTKPVRRSATESTPPRFASKATPFAASFSPRSACSAASTASGRSLARWTTAS